MGVFQPRLTVPPAYKVHAVNTSRGRRCWPCPFHSQKLGEQGYGPTNTGVTDLRRKFFRDLQAGANAVRPFYVGRTMHPVDTHQLRALLNLFHIGLRCTPVRYSQGVCLAIARACDGRWGHGDRTWKTEQVVRRHERATPIFGVPAAGAKMSTTMPLNGAQSDRATIILTALSSPLPEPTPRYASGYERLGATTNPSPAENGYQVEQDNGDVWMGGTTGWGRKPHLFQYLTYMIGVGAE